jgi:predicted flap endonuclease-1-like 5' DNA nuclease
MKRLARFIAIAAAAAGITWWIRERAVPMPQTPEEHPPHFRTAPRPPSGPQPDVKTPDGDDLAVIKGIGPVYRERLAAAGVTTFAQLVAADAATLATTVEVSVTLMEDWQRQAHTLA